MKDRRILSLEEIDLFIKWFFLNVLDSTKRKVLILIGIEGAYNTAKHRKQECLTIRTSKKAIAAAESFGYNFDKAGK